MNDSSHPQALPTWKKFLRSTAIILVVALMLNATWYVLFEMTVKTPIPAPYGLTYVLVQTLILIVLNGYIHYKQRESRKKNTFSFVYSLLVLVITNSLFFAFICDIENAPSIDEMNRLYGEPHVPNSLLSLSIPVALVPCLLGMFGIPALVYGKRSAEEASLVQTFRSKALQFFKVYLLVAAVLILVNVLFFYFYTGLGPTMPTGDFLMGEMIQMTFASTAVAVLLYMYITDNGREGLGIYIILTLCVTGGTFVASLPNPHGQPVYDESLWFSVPLAIFSLIAEMIGIPRLFRNMEKKRKALDEKDQRSYLR